MSQRLVSVDDLVTLEEIAKRCKMSKTAVRNIVSGRDGRKRLGFPRPVTGKGARGIWLWPEVNEWYTNTMPRTAEGRRRAARASAMKYRQTPRWQHGKRTA